MHGKIETQNMDPSLKRARHGEHFPESWDQALPDKPQVVGVPGAAGRGHNASEQRPESSDHSERCPENSDWDLG